MTEALELTNKVKRDNRGMGTHQRTKGITQDWITPQALIEALGPFDLDPCASVTQPWPTAARMLTVHDNGLKQKWSGSVWLNPPYETRSIGEWMARLADHGSGMALIFARTETEWFHDHVWNKADAIYFLRGRINFYTPQGSRAEYNSGAPSCLVSYGYGCTEKIRLLERVPRGWPGKFVGLKE